MSDDPAPETPTPPAGPARVGGRPTARLVALIADDGREPAPSLTDAEAEATWAAVSAPWHPAILARVDRLPEVEGLDTPSPPERGEVRVVAGGGSSRLVSGHRAQADDAGAILIDGGPDRPALVRSILERLDPAASAGEPDDPLALDFLALGTARWMLRDLTLAMGHADGLDAESLTREVLAGAAAWAEGDAPGATNRLRAAFELLTQARERFYPVDDYLVDLTLIDPSTPPSALAEALRSRAPLTLLATARGIEALATASPETVAAVRAAVDEGWSDVVGGPYDEADEPLLPLESILWQYRHGGEVYREHLDTRNVETLARRRFGLYPMLPQVARRFGLRFALHMAFDPGHFPVPSDAKRLWESPDGSSLEAILRPPLAADRPADGPRLPWRLARTLKDDHVATLVLAHWPEPVAGWYRDLRRVAAYSPVLARWVTAGDYFHLTDRPWDVLRPGLDEYVTPYLAQAVARDDPSPVGRRVRHAGLRGRMEALLALDAIGRALRMPRPTPADAPPPGSPAGGPGEPPACRPWAGLEETLETGRLDEAGDVLDRELAAAGDRLAEAVVGTGEGRPGFLVVNTLGVARRAAVLLPGAAPGLAPEGPLRASQFTEEGVWGVVDLPAFGFAWVPSEPSPEGYPELKRAVSAAGHVLRNESLEVEVDPKTGGLRGVRAPGEPLARLGQQLVVAGLTTPDGQPGPSVMQARGFEVEYGGPALVQAVSRGVLLDPSGTRTLATFRQRVRLWSGRPTLELDIALADLDAHWLGRLARSDPWASYLACRWAWPDPGSSLRRLALHAPEPTESPRPETAEAFEVATRRQRTALLFGGLAHHRRQGPRMLDTLLLAGRESRREFRLGVALDLEHPFHAALDLATPAAVVPTPAGPPRSGPAGWVFHGDRPSVAVTRVEAIDSSGEGRGPGLAFHLLETAGRACRFRLRLFRDPSWARQTDFQGDLVVDLPVEGDAVLVDLTPRELARIEVTLA